MSPRVYNKRDRSVPKDAVYVGRPTKYGNPFYMRGEADRTAVVAQFRLYLMSNPHLVAACKEELKGKDLVCWCAPLPCHADVLLEIANAPEEEVKS